ncbi:MAG: hypothetical protein ACI406_01735, partial [Victivallis vadensis]
RLHHHKIFHIEIKISISILQGESPFFPNASRFSILFFNFFRSDLDKATEIGHNINMLTKRFGKFSKTGSRPV